MFGERKVNLRFTERARDFIKRHMTKSNLRSPVLSIGWSRFNQEPGERWFVGFYDRKDVREGWLGVAPEFEFVVIQEWILDAVDNRVMDIDDDRGTVTFDPPAKVEA